MKKKVAVFTNGWSEEYLDFALEGIKKRAAEDNIDLFIFLDYTFYDKTKEDITGELNILNLPDLTRFDGVLLLGNTLTNAGEITILREKILKAKVTALCLEYALDDINCIRTESVHGMKELMEHMITVHGVKDIFWISGPKGNEESDERYRAIVETMSSHGLSVDPDKTFDGAFSYAIVEEQMPAIISKMEKLPDAFICANDFMAMGVCVALSKVGIDVPKDVYVTGFDNVTSGNHFSPMLTSVDRGWETRSYQAMDNLIELMNGAPDFGDKIYKSKFDPGESCGCTVTEEAVEIQRKARQRVFMLPKDRTIFDLHLIAVDECIANVRTTDDIHTAFFELCKKDHTYEGDNFYICLDRAFVDSMESTDWNITCNVTNYSDELDVIYGMHDGKAISRQTIALNELVPDYDPDSAESAVYLFVPLHTGETCMGYYVNKNFTQTIRDFYLNSLINHYTSALTRARQNIKLEKLNELLSDISVRDELTGLYNRTGYDKIVVPYLNELRSAKQKSVILVADINRMKMINDKYGHLQGDLAIKIVANILKSSIPSEWKPVRYGGDEYVTIGGYDDSIDMENLKTVIIEKAQRISQDLCLPFTLSVSVGYVIIDSNNTLQNEEYFRMADEAMYEMKQDVHKKDHIE